MVTKTRYIICSSNEEYIAACRERIQDVSTNLEIATLQNANHAFSMTWNVLLDRQIWGNNVSASVFDDYIAEARKYESMLNKRKASVPERFKDTLDYFSSSIRIRIAGAQALRKKLLVRSA